RAVAAFRVLPWLFAVVLDDLRVVDAQAERALNRVEVHAVPVGRELDTPVETLAEVHHEGVGVLAAAVAALPGGDELRVRVDRGERPHVAVSEGVSVLLGNVLFLRVAESPNLIDLEALAVEVAHHAVLV